MENHLIHIDIEKLMHTANGPMKLTVKTEIGSGELVALFGPSGAGKTTLLRILSGLTDPDKGVVKFGDTVWYDSEKKINLPSQQRNIGFMFQDYALFPNMTVEENILFAQTVKDAKAASELISIFGLNELRKRKPSKLSGGQKQRVALARALARKPQLLLLDEPLSALDAEMRVMLQDEIRHAHELLGTTTIMVSHDLNEVFRLASHVVMIENGEIKKTGKPETVFSDNTISGKVQITGQIARIERQDPINIVTVISGSNQIIKVIAFDSDLENLKLGDQVMVYTKAFNPIISKLG
ncbi:MAG: ATP-binding cassette domain-containing protein [Bacteroidales bacterium]|nr:ATP-binding cassette domain-containing protein [Bacteroidales bacterium]